jgi:hypothetical protein
MVAAVAMAVATAANAPDATVSRPVVMASEEEVTEELTLVVTLELAVLGS